MYDANKDRQPQQQNDALGRNPYAALADPQVDAPSSAPLPGGQGGPTATGHVNFDQVYNANSGVAAREAGKLQTSAVAKGEAAKYGLTGAQSTFDNAARTGATTGPTQAQQNWAKYGSTGVVQPKKVTAAVAGDARTGQQGAVTEEQQGLNGDLPPVGTEPPTPDDPAQQAALEAGVRQGAAGQYTGPNALSDLESYAQLAQEMAAAQDQASTLASGNAGIQAQGMNATDAALLGASGRKGFEELGQRYGGLKGQLDAANVASKGTADAARKQTQDAANAYQGLLGEYQGRVSADQDLAKKTNASSDKILGNAAAEGDAKSRFNEYLHGGSDMDKFRNTLHTIGRATDLSDAVTSGNGLVTKGTNAISPMGADNKGNVWGGWGDDDYDVWASMSQSDWDAFAGMSDPDKHTWIAERKKKLRGGG